MAFSYYLNMECMSLEIASDPVSCMTDSNLSAEIESFLDDKALINNVKQGYVIVTSLHTFAESFLNTILRDCMLCRENLLKGLSIENKLGIICLFYKVDFSILKSDFRYAILTKVTGIRNELIHYKKNYIGDGTGIPGFSIKKSEIADFFIKHVVSFADFVATQLGLKIFNDVGIFSCDGRDSLVSYVYDPIKANIDESSFE